MTAPATLDKPPRNNAVFRWSGRFNKWNLAGRYFDPNIAKDQTTHISGVVIDLLSGRMIAKNGTFCSRQRPQGIRSMPALEKWETVAMPEGVTTITPEDNERRDLRFIGKGVFQFHIMLWGDSAPKVQIGILADSVDAAKETALHWGRHNWWKDQRAIGIDTIEIVVHQAST